MEFKQEYPELKSIWKFESNDLEVRVLMITNINPIHGCNGVDIVFEVCGSGKPCSMSIDEWNRQMKPYE